MKFYNQSKYTKEYYKIINSRKNRDLDSEIYYEKHHIIPLCLGGSNKKENLVRLTPREHYLCHKLLLRMVKTPKHRTKMAYAILKMGVGVNRQKIANSKDYEMIRTKLKKYLTGKNNPFYGKKHSKKNLKLFSENGKKFYGRLASSWGRGSNLDNNEYVFVSPDGNQSIVRAGICDFCEKNGLHRGSIMKMAKRGSGVTKNGWAVVLRKKR